MSIRTDLLAGITTSVTGSSVSVATELPWVAGGIPLHVKNMKKIYLDAEEVNQEVLHQIIGGNDIMRHETLVDAYLTVDGKNPPSDIDTIITSVIANKNIILDCFVQECDVETTIEEDRLTYRFQFRLVRIN